MSVITDYPSTKNDEGFVLTANDRCDSCSAQAYVKVTGKTGELLFCNHHYNKIMDNAVGYDKMMKFMTSILDERYRLTETKSEEN